MPAMIQLGTTRQLFLDDYLAESAPGVRRVFHPPDKVSAAPVLPPQHPWEGNAAVLRKMLFDPLEERFRLWYGTSTVVSRRSAASGEIDIDYSGPSRLCLAESADGVDWRRPELGCVEYDGSTRNNLLPQGGPLDGAKGLVIDPRERDPQKRYKTLARTSCADPAIVRQLEADPSVYYRMDQRYEDELKRKGNWSSLTWELHHSPDGIHWHPYDGNPIRRDPPQARTWAGPARLMGWDPIRQVYALHMESCQHARCPLFKRLIGRSESPDMVAWSRPETIIVPDEDDPPDTQFYYADVVAYQGLYVAMLGVYYTERGVIFPQLAYSRDGIHYERPVRAPWIGHGEEDAFDGREIYAEAPLVSGDRLLFPYYGRVAGHGAGPLYEREMGAHQPYSGIGLATSPLDGLAALEAQDQGEVITRSFSFDGERLELNVAAVDGAEMETRVEVLGPAHHHVPGYTAAECDPIRSPGCHVAVRWNGSADLSRLAGEPIKLRFVLRGAGLRAFQFVTASP